MVVPPGERTSWWCSSEVEADRFVPIGEECAGSLKDVRTVLATRESVYQNNEWSLTLSAVQTCDQTVSASISHWQDDSLP